VSDLDARAARLWLAALVLLPLGARAVFAASVELSPDEAYYLAWARAPDWGYLDHPPLVAWMVALSTSLLGESELSVRLPSLLGGAALTWLLYGTARVLGAQRRSALVTTAAASFTLLFSAGAVLATPDAPLSLAWALAVFFLARTAFAQRFAAAIAATTAMAAGFLAKLPMGLLALWSAVAPSPLSIRRRILLALAALVGLTPVLLWNALHGWPMFTFHAARITERAGASLKTFGEFLVGQVGLLCLFPALFLGAAWASGLRRTASPALRFATVLSLGPVVSVAVLSLVTKVEANWIAPAYGPAFAGLALWLDRLPRGARWMAGAAAFAAAVTLAAHVHVLWPFLPLPVERDPAAQLHGWRTLARVVRDARGDRPVLASRYQEASELAFYLPDPRVSTLPGGLRPSQYDLWPSPGRQAAQALCVWREGEGPPRGLRLEVYGRTYRVVRCDLRSGTRAPLD
jgi:4-amino-4-deoxy-L-arabinose transferase-like glycosyltransferase